MATLGVKGLKLLVYWTGTVLIVSHATGGGGIRAICSDVTHYFPTSSPVSRYKQLKGLSPLLTQLDCVYMIRKEPSTRCMLIHKFF